MCVCVLVKERMSQVLIKKYLKKAKEAILVKQYEEALDASLSVLDYDEENYNAYLSSLRGQLPSL